MPKKPMRNIRKSLDVKDHPVIQAWLKNDLSLLETELDFCQWFFLKGKPTVDWGLKTVYYELPSEAHVGDKIASREYLL
jgi:hypothetical protein